MVQILIESGIPKSTLIDMAFDDCGIAGYSFEKTADEYVSALQKLNAMMWEWPFDQLGYIQPPVGDGNPSDASGVANRDTQVIVTMLAERIAPGVGKALSPEQRAARKRSFAQLCSRVSVLPRVKFPAQTVRGSGYDPYRAPGYEPFIYEGGLSTEPDTTTDPGDLAAIVAE